MSVRSLAVALLFAVASHAVADAQARPQINTDPSGVAVHGYDPVSYFAAGAPAKGNAAITATHDGATYRFASTANRDAFVAEPEKYVPQFGGYCAMGVAVGGKYDVDPDAWRIVDGRLYLNKDAKTQRTWVKDVPGNIVRAVANWQKIRDEGFARR